MTEDIGVHLGIELDIPVPSRRFLPFRRPAGGNVFILTRLVLHVQTGFVYGILLHRTRVQQNVDTATVAVKTTVRGHSSLVPQCLDVFAKTASQQTVDVDLAVGGSVIHPALVTCMHPSRITEHTLAARPPNSNRGSLSAEILLLRKYQPWGKLYRIALANVFHSVSGNANRLAPDLPNSAVECWDGQGLCGHSSTKLTRRI